MCITGLKKTAEKLEANYQILELDELYWFVERKARTETRENVYLFDNDGKPPATPNRRV